MEPAGIDPNRSEKMVRSLTFSFLVGSKFVSRNTVLGQAEPCFDFIPPLI